MSLLRYAVLFLVVAGLNCFGQGMRISAYPNTNNLGYSNLFIVAIKGTPGTNMNISWEQLSNLVYNSIGVSIGLVSTNYSDSKSNFIVTTHGTASVTNNLIITGKVGIGTNNPQSMVEIFGTNDNNGYLFRVGSGNIANGTNGFVVGTNNYVGIRTPPATFGSGIALDVVGSIRSSLNIGANSGLITTTLGVGTNSPAVMFHIAGNNAQNVIQAGTTNKPEQFRLTTNGLLSVNPGGGLNQLGCYGFIGMNDTNLIVCAGAAGIYTNVAGTDGFTTITTNGFVGNTAAIFAGLTNLYAGWYRVTICMSGQGDNNQAIEGEVFTNGVACDLIGFKKTYDAAARMDDMSMTGIIYLPANCGTQFMVQDAGTGGDIMVHRASLTIGTP